MKKSTAFLFSIICLFGGVILGFLLATAKGGVHFGNNYEMHR